jgi:hypothetical protein
VDFCGDGDRRGVQEFCDIATDHGGADENLPVFVEHHSGAPFVSVGVQCGPGHLAEVAVHGPNPDCRGG